MVDRVCGKLCSLSTHAASSHLLLEWHQHRDEQVYACEGGNIKRKFRKFNLLSVQAWPEQRSFVQVVRDIV